MCGIAGIVKLDPYEQAEEERLVRMRDIIAHRGPDGQGLIFGDGSNASEPFALFRIPALGGTAVDLRFSMVPSPNPIRLSPDGRRIAYTERIVERELWIAPLTP